MLTLIYGLPVPLYIREYDCTDQQKKKIVNSLCDTFYNS